MLEIEMQSCHSASTVLWSISSRPLQLPNIPASEVTHKGGGGVGPLLPKKSGIAGQDWAASPLWAGHPLLPPSRLVKQHTPLVIQVCLGLCYPLPHQMLGHGVYAAIVRSGSTLHFDPCNETSPCTPQATPSPHICKVAALGSSTVSGLPRA